MVEIFLDFRTQKPTHTYKVDGPWTGILCADESLSERISNWLFLVWQFCYTWKKVFLNIFCIELKYFWPRILSIVSLNTFEYDELIIIKAFEIHQVYNYIIDLASRNFKPLLIWYQWHRRFSNSTSDNMSQLIQNVFNINVISRSQGIFLIGSGPGLGPMFDTGNFDTKSFVPKLTRSRTSLNRLRLQI